MKCADCRYHIEAGSDDKGQKVGACMRFPPNAYDHLKASMPVVGSDVTWCGEFSHANWFKRLITG